MSDLKYEKVPFWKKLSYSFMDLQIEVGSFPIGLYLLLFYETEVYLNIWYVTFAYVVYAIWNAINDPLVGLLSDVPRKYWSKWGKRFPMLLFCGIPMALSFYMIFVPPAWDPNTQPWNYTIWFIVATCLFDTFFSVLSTSHNAFFPELFRSDKDRRAVGSLRMELILVGTLLGAIVPGMIVVYKDRATYGTMAMVFAGLGVIFWLISLPGHYEPKQMRVTYSRAADEHKQLPFLQVLKIMLKERNFMMYIFIFFLDSIIGASLSSSISYILRYDLHLPAGDSILVMGGFVAAAVLSIPVWLFVSNKINDNRKMLILGVFLNTIFLLPLVIYWNLPSLIVATVLLGIGGGALRVGRTPVLSDVVDEVIVKHKVRIEGSMMGIYTFFNRFALIAQGLIFATVHTLTGFIAENDYQEPLAKFGIRIHAALIPMILSLLGLILFVKFYDLNREKTTHYQEQLAEMGI